MEKDNVSKLKDLIDEVVEMMIDDLLDLLAKLNRMKDKENEKRL